MRASLVVAVVAAFAVVTALAGAGSTPAPAFAPALTERTALPAEYVPGEVIVRFRDGVNRSERSRAARRSGARLGRSLALAGTEVVELTGGQTVEEAVAEFEDDPDVLFAEPNYVRHATAIPDDTDFAQLWGLSQASDADIDAPEAWNVTTGSSSVIVAVIDTGVAYEHPDLAPNIWVNDDPAGGGDDDGNGFVDDTHGWDFVQDDNTPLDFYGHGTHVAGTIGAKGNNALGVTGVNWDVSLMPLRAGDTYGNFYADDGVQAILYACANGARVVNGSYAGNLESLAEEAAIRSPACADTLFVFAAGNTNLNNDSHPAYPCSYAAARIICVAASTKTDTRAGYSNYGVKSVDVAAPGGGGGSFGGEILSTFNDYVRVGLSEDDDFEDVDWNTRWVQYNALTSWGQQTGVASSGVRSLADSPSGSYAPGSNASIRNAAPFDFSGQAGCIAVYNLRLDTELGATEATTDWFRVRTGTSPAAIETVVDEWTEEDLPFSGWYSDLSAVDGSATAYLRFSVDADADGNVGDGANIDQFGVGCLDRTSARVEKLIGTSMAAPQVAGAAALVLAAHPAYTPAKVKAAILNTVDKKGAFASIGSRGRLNAARALVYTAPNTIHKSSPPRRTTKRRATFRFTSSGYKSHFQCKLNKNAWRSCSSGKTYTRLKRRSYTFRVRAIDQAGNIDPTPIVRTWRITR